MHDELKRAGLETAIQSGVVIAGGGSRLRGLAELAERMYSLPVRVATPHGLDGLTEEVLKPEFATVIGLVMYGARARQAVTQRSTSIGAKLKSLFAGG